MAVAGEERRAQVQSIDGVDAIAVPLQLDGETVSIGASVGIAVFPGDADSRDARLVARQAQEAVREAQTKLAQLDAKLAARETGRAEAVRTHWVLGEVKLEGTAHTLEGLGTVRGALKVAVGVHQGAEALGNCVGLGEAVSVEGEPGNLEAASVGSTGVEVDGADLTLPMFKGFQLGAAWAGAEV